MTRPEEERGEVVPEPRPQSPHDRAQALVSQWEATVSQFSALGGMWQVIVLTSDVRDHMAADITALLNDTISREHNTP